MRTPPRLVLFIALVTALLARAPRAWADGSLEIVADDGRSWDAVVREVQDDPSAEGRTYRLAVTTWGAKLTCGQYALALDAVGAQAFTLGACDPETRTTAVRVALRAALFEPGDVAPRPRAAAIHASQVQTVTARGGADGPVAGSRVGCSVWLQPYVWDGLNGRALALPPDRYELRPLDETIHAAPDGAGWIARGESHMAVSFHYAIVDRKTGAQVVENVATLACADTPAEKAPAALDVPTTSADLANIAPIDKDAASAAPAPAPRTFAFSVGYDLGWVTGPSPGIETGGARIGVGARPSERWYVGASVRPSFVIALEGMGGGPSVQVGGETRFAFHSSPTGGQWLGLRGGVDLAESGRHFAEIEWCPELRAGKGRTQVGFLAATGLTFGGPEAVASYVSVGFHIGMGL
jgi:hypothetical protein